MNCVCLCRGRVKLVLSTGCSMSTFSCEVCVTLHSKICVNGPHPQDCRGPVIASQARSLSHLAVGIAGGNEGQRMLGRQQDVRAGALHVKPPPPVLPQPQRHARGIQQVIHHLRAGSPCFPTLYCALRLQCHEASGALRLQCHEASGTAKILWMDWPLGSCVCGKRTLELSL